MTCREIADEFIVAVEWFQVSWEESRNVVIVLESYPRRSIVIELFAPTTDQWGPVA